MQLSNIVCITLHCKIREIVFNEIQWDSADVVGGNTGINADTVGCSTVVGL